MGDVGGTHPSQSQTNLLYLEPVAVDLSEFAFFNYQIANKADPDPTVVSSVSPQGLASGFAGASLASD